LTHPDQVVCKVGIKAAKLRALMNQYNSTPERGILDYRERVADRAFDVGAKKAVNSCLGG
jgi:hypothetical protein